MHELKKQFFKVEGFKLKRTFQFLSAEQIHRKVSASWASMMSIDSRTRKQGNAENPKTNLKKLINSAKKSLELKVNNNFKLKMYSIIKTKEDSLHSSKSKTQNKFFKAKSVNTNLDSNMINNNNKYHTKVYDIIVDSPISSSFEEFYKKHDHKKGVDSKAAVEKGPKYLSKLNTPIKYSLKLSDKGNCKDSCDLSSSKFNSKNFLNKTSKFLEVNSPESHQNILDRSIVPVGITSIYDDICFSNEKFFIDNISSKKQLRPKHFNMIKSNKSINHSPAPDAVVPSFTPHKNKISRVNYANMFDIDETPEFNKIDDGRELFDANKNCSLTEKSKIPESNNVNDYIVNDKIFDETIKSHKKSCLSKNMVCNGKSLNETIPSLSENTPFGKSYIRSYRGRNNKNVLLSPQNENYKNITKKCLFIEDHTPVTTHHKIQSERESNLMGADKNIGNESGTPQIMKDHITKRVLFNLKTRLLDGEEIIENNKTEPKTDKYNGHFDNSFKGNDFISPINMKTNGRLVTEQNLQNVTVVQNLNISLNCSENSSSNSCNEPTLNHITTISKTEDKQELPQFACTDLKWKEIEEDDLTTSKNHDELEDEDVSSIERVTEVSKNVKHEVHEVKKKKQVKCKKNQMKSKLISNPLVRNGYEQIKDNKNFNENNVNPNLEGNNENEKCNIVGNIKEKEADECKVIGEDVLLNDEQAVIKIRTDVDIKIKNGHKSKNIKLTSRDSISHNVTSLTDDSLVQNKDFSEAITKESLQASNLLSSNSIDETQLDLVSEQLIANMLVQNIKLSFDHGIRDDITCNKLDNGLAMKTVQNVVKDVSIDEFLASGQATCLTSFEDENYQNGDHEMENVHNDNQLVYVENQNNFNSSGLRNDLPRLMEKPFETKFKRGTRRNGKKKIGKTQKKKVWKTDARPTVNKLRQIQDKIDNVVHDEIQGGDSSEKFAEVPSNEETDNAEKMCCIQTTDTIIVDADTVVDEKPKTSIKATTKKITQLNALSSTPDVLMISLQSTISDASSNTSENNDIKSNHNINNDHFYNEVIEFIKTPVSLKGNVTADQLDEKDSQRMMVTYQKNKMTSNMENQKQINECDLLKDGELSKMSEITNHNKQTPDTNIEELCVSKEKKPTKNKKRKSKRKMNRKKVIKNNYEMSVDNFGNDEITYNINANNTSTATNLNTTGADDMMANKGDKNDLTIESTGKISDKNSNGVGKREINSNDSNWMEQNTSEVIDLQEANAPSNNNKEMIFNFNDGQDFINDHRNKEFDVPNEDVAIDNLNRSNNHEVNAETPGIVHENDILLENKNIAESINNKDKNNTNQKVNSKKRKAKSKKNKNKKRKNIQNDEASETNYKTDNVDENCADNMINTETPDNEINIGDNEMMVNEVSCNMDEVQSACLDKKINDYETNDHQMNMNTELCNIDNKVDTENITAENDDKIYKTPEKDKSGNETLNKKDDDDIITDEGVDPDFINNPIISHGIIETSPTNFTSMPIANDVNDNETDHVSPDENCVDNNEQSKKQVRDEPISDEFSSNDISFNNNGNEIVNHNIKSSFKICMVTSVPHVVNKDDVKKHCMNLLSNSVHLNVPDIVCKNFDNKESDVRNHGINQTNNAAAANHKLDRFDNAKRLVNVSSPNQLIKMGINNNENAKAVDNSLLHNLDNHNYNNNNNPMKRSLLNKDDMNSPECFHPNDLKRPKCSLMQLQNINYVTNNNVDEINNDNNNCNNVRVYNTNHASNMAINDANMNGISNICEPVDFSQVPNDKSTKTCSGSKYNEGFYVHQPSQEPQHYATRSSMFHYYVTKYVPLSQKSDNDKINDEEANAFMHNNNVRTVNNDPLVETNAVDTINDINNRDTIQHKTSINFLTLTNNISCTNENNVTNDNLSHQNNTIATLTTTSTTTTTAATTTTNNNNETNIETSRIPFKKRRVSFSGLTIVNIHPRLPSSYDDSLESLGRTRSQDHKGTQNIENVTANEDVNNCINDNDGGVTENIRKSILKKSSRYDQIIERYENSNVGNNYQNDHLDDVTDTGNGDTDLDVSSATCDESVISENPYINLQGPHIKYGNEDNFSQLSLASTSLLGSSFTASPTSSSLSSSSLPMIRKVSSSRIEMLRYDDRDIASNDINLMRELMINEFKEQYFNINNSTNVESNSYDNHTSESINKIYEAINNADINRSVVYDQNDNNNGLTSSSFNIQAMTHSASMLQNETNPFAMLNAFQSSLTADNIGNNDDAVNKDDNTSANNTSGINVSIENDTDENTQAKNITNIPHDVGADINYISNILGSNPLNKPSFSLTHIPSDIVDMKIDYDEKDLEALFKHLPNANFEKIAEKTGWADDLYD